MSGLFVKVCGLGRKAEVAAAAAAGADAVGFVHWPPSPRHLGVEEISKLAAGSPLPCYLVTVDLPAHRLIELAASVGVGGVQPHGRHAASAAAAASSAGLSVIRPIRPARPAADIPADQLLLVDTPHAHLPGGSGTTFDWSLLAGFDRPFILAGGLGPDNVAAAVRTVRPFGVDASTRLESAPGVKDVGLIRQFVEEAKGA